MTGHMLGAAGAVEAIASVMTLKTGIIAPTIHYEQPDEDCDLNYVPNQAVKADVTLANFRFSGIWRIIMDVSHSAN